MPDVVQNGARVGNQKRGKLAIVGPGADDGLLIDGTVALVKEKRGLRTQLRHIGLDPIHADVTLALLFRIIEGVGVEEGPDELTADVFQAELEVSVLVDGVVAAIKSGCANVEPLLIGDLFGSDEAGRVAGAGGGNGGIEGMREGVAEGDARGRCLHGVGGRNTIEHARLRGHAKD